MILFQQENNLIKENIQTASELFNSLDTIWKDKDYRCLKPNSHKDPTKWRTYEIHGYRRAFNNNSLNSVKSFKYDENFNNFIDPKVMKEYTKSTKSTKDAWRKSYGFQTVFTKRKWDGKNWDSGDLSSCFRKCADWVSLCVILDGVLKNF